MTKRQPSVHHQKEPQPPSHSKLQAKVVPKKKDTKKPVRKQAPKTKAGSMTESGMDGPSVNGDIQTRIAERAYELHRHRGGHHGQDVDDWLTAEREVLSEEPC